MATQSAGRLGERETRFNPDDLRFRLSPIDEDEPAIQALSANSRHILHSNQPSPDVALRRLVASRYRVWKDHRDDRFLGLHLVRSSDELGSDLLACYSVSLDDQDVRVPRISPQAYLCDILIRDGISGNSGLVPLIMANFYAEAQSWACNAEEIRTVGLYVSKPALFGEMPKLGFTHSASQVKTRCHGEAAFFTKKFGPGLG